MAMIRCPECGREVSDKAKNCVGCGYPIEANLYADMNNYANNNGVIRSNNTSAYNVENQNAIGQAVDTYSASVAPQKKKKYTVIKIVIGICILVFLFSFIKNIIGKTKEELASRNTVEEVSVINEEAEEVTDEISTVESGNEISYEIGNYLQIRNVQFYVPKSIADGDCMNSGKAGMGYSRKIKDSFQLLMIKASDYFGKATLDELVEGSRSALDSSIGEYNIQIFEDKQIDFECNNNAFIAGGVKYNFSTMNQIHGRVVSAAIKSNDKLIYILYMDNTNNQDDNVDDLIEMIENANICESDEYTIKDMNNRIISSKNVNEENVDSNKKENNSEGISSSSVSPDLKAMLDEYEKFMDEYIDFMEKYQAGATTVEMLTEYTEILSKYTEFTNKINDVDQKTLSKADEAYYLEVTMRVEKKLLNALK